MLFIYAHEDNSFMIRKNYFSVFGLGLIHTCGRLIKIIALGIVLWSWKFIGWWSLKQSIALYSAFQ